MRTRENYDEAVEASASNPEKSSDTGIRSCCVLNCSKSFHFGENLILDAMHDFLEGVVPFMIKLFLRQLYSCGTTKISAAELNRRIVLFHFSFYDLFNKPSPKFTDAGIRKEDILFSPKIALEQIVVLEDLIRQFVERFRNCIQVCNQLINFITWYTTQRGSSPIPDDGLVSNAKWIKFNGWEYRRHSVVLLTPSSDTKDGLLEFGKISNVLVHHGNPFFVLTIMITDNFNSHFHSFEVWSPETEQQRRHWKKEHSVRVVQHQDAARNVFVPAGMLVTIEEPSTSQDTLSNTAEGDGLEPELDASGTETEICNIEEPTAKSDSQLVWEAGILLVLRQKFYLPFEALLFVSDAIHDNYQKSVTTIHEQLKVLLTQEVTGSPSFQQTFETLSHQHQLTRYRLEMLWKKYFPTIMPQSVILNETEPSYDWEVYDSVM
ncbi:hypothetical protein OUZ56_012595 [Daphnia magna]|uniref:Uncharacterized protein n=1 Tax=Daphnia magna TaxID=35525 RepID=A0ABQ9Z3H2_9CRUS|nr:hypothetical protein OUZ56_012595 [Daphnia magna]